MHLDPEQSYVCDLARAWAERVDGTVPPQGPLDPARLMRLLESQPAMQALVPHLDQEIFPEKARERVSAALQASRYRTAMMLLELERILPAMEAADCKPVVLKGGALALTVYDRPEDRWFVDLDLLVEPEQLERVYEVLQELGYGFYETPLPARYYDEFHFHRIMSNSWGICLEIHWAVTMPGSVYRYDLAALRADACEVELGESSFLAPGSCDQILHGVLQSIAGGFRDLRRILDLQRLDETLDATDYETLCDRALEANLTTGLWLQYRVRELLFDKAMPALVAEGCRPSDAVVSVLEKLGVARECMGPPTRVSAEYSRMLHWLCVPPEYRRHEVRRFVLPGEAELMEAGLGFDRPVPPWQRFWLSVCRLWVTGRMLGRVARAAI